MIIDYHGKRPVGNGSPMTLWPIQLWPMTHAVTNHD